jgi:RNA polymerase sigma-70 factor (ECF subfamily)
MMDTINIVENEVVTRAQAGDPEACREIIEKMHQPMLGFIYRILGPNHRQQMEDIAQDVFLKVFRVLDRFDVERGVKFSTWVFTFTRNHCLDILKKKRLPMFSMAAADDEDQVQRTFEDTRVADPRRVAEGAEIGERIDAALRTINPEQRQVFEMRERRGMEYVDIARHMGVAEGTVKSRLHRARLALRELLADLGRGMDPEPTPV